MSASNLSCSNYPATTSTSTLSLHDALPILRLAVVAHDPVGVELGDRVGAARIEGRGLALRRLLHQAIELGRGGLRSEEHTSELQSQSNLVCRLLLEKKKTDPLVQRLVDHII